VQFEGTVPTVADRRLQRAVARIIEAVFKADFLDCSHGFRPGRNPHHALQALRLQIVSKKVNHVFGADICSYFTRISHQWLRKMVAHRIATLLFVAISFTLLGLWAARALTAPLSSFASAAESFSLNGAAALLPERGPEEIRSVAKALNRMRERITILIDDRTRMLAAISTT
jgi:HAMP domain-containing protein